MLVVGHPDPLSLLGSDGPVLAANKRLVFDMYRNVIDANREVLADLYIAEDYIQHNPNVATGREAALGHCDERPAAASVTGKLRSHDSRPACAKHPRYAADVGGALSTANGCIVLAVPSRTPWSGRAITNVRHATRPRERGLPYGYV